MKKTFIAWGIILSIVIVWVVYQTTGKITSYFLGVSKIIKTNSGEIGVTKYREALERHKAEMADMTWERYKDARSEELHFEIKIAKAIERVYKELSKMNMVD